MLKLVNRFILFFIPYLPMFFVKMIAGRYVAGETCDEALEIIHSLNAKGFSATIDILGEHVSSADTARQVTGKYRELYDAIDRRALDCNVSIKPSHIGLDLGEDIFRNNLNTLLDAAEKKHNFLRIDMESSKVTDVTIKFYKECLNKYPRVGTVFQAYLFRTLPDIKPLIGPHFNYRLCKGIYKESPDIAIQERQDINKNYLDILRYTFANEGYVGIATHDLKLIQKCVELINELNVPKDQFEFQVLHGVPMSGWLDRLKQMGFKVRIYVPFGPEWYAYSVRRLQENPNIVMYILHNLFRRS